MKERPIDAYALIERLVKNGWMKQDALKDSTEMIAVQAALDDMPTLTPSIFWRNADEEQPATDARHGVSPVVWALDSWGKTGFAIYHDDRHELQHGAWFTGGSVGEDGRKITHWMYLPGLPGEVRR